MAAMQDGEFAALQSLLKAQSRDAVRQLCQDCFSSPPTGLGQLAQRVCPGLAADLEEAEQLVSALHRLTRHVVYHGLRRAEDILSLFPENFHQNLKNLLTKIILDNISGWRNEAQASQNSHALEEMRKDDTPPRSSQLRSKTWCVAFGAPPRSSTLTLLFSLPQLVDMDWRVDIKTSSDSISKMAIPTCLLQLQIQEDDAICGNGPVVSALTVELSKETLDTMLEGLGRIRDQLSAVANK